MADRIVRSLRQVETIDRLADFLTEENDLISTSDGHIYVRTDTGYYKLTFYNDLKTLINKYSGQIENHDIAINDNKEKISTFLEKIKKFQPMIDSNKKEIDSLKEKDVILNESLEQHQTQLNEFEKSMLQYDDKYEKLTQSLNATKDSVGRNTDEINLIKANTGAENIDALKRELAEVKKSFNIDKIKDIERQIELLKSKQNNDNTIQEIQEDINKLKQNSSAGKLESLEQTINDIKANTNLDKIKELETKLNSINQKDYTQDINSIKSDIATLKTNNDKISKIEKDIQELKDRPVVDGNGHIDLSKYDNDISDLKQKTTTNSSNINSLSTKVDNLNIDTKIAQSKSEIEQNFNQKINSEKLQFNDTGWKNVNLESGITTDYNSNAYPPIQYRIVTINNVKTIQLKGIFTGIKTNKEFKIGTINANLKSTHHYTQCSIDNKMINTRMYLNFKGELHFVTSNYSDSELSNGDKRFAIDTQIIE
ncbi:structure protein putative minor tail protein [Staphylococcus phage S24-1]|uniref:Structure protein putative minor tail protein n=1 Tax=Staphylococcus phage S24-1 TaxID=1010614 RepID=G9M947_BPPS4|nr:tail protein [Staphylococcus phage S24-1]BAL42301.1 structure protein putative minor tail protein [Staphylococcus phage S24-1]